jgi:ribokinase
MQNSIIKTPQAKKVLLLGDINIDALLSVPEFPEHGSEVLTERADMRLGGSITNSAVVLSKLGFQTSLISCMGQDIWGAMASDLLTKCGIGQEWIRISSEQSTGLNFIVVTPDDERTMFGIRGANVILSPCDISEQSFSDADLLHISGYALMQVPQRDSALRAVEIASRNNIPISLDTAFIPVMENPHIFRDLLPKIQICILGMDEATQIFGSHTAEELAKQMLQEGVQMAAIKLGRDGCNLHTSHQSLQFPAFQVDSIDSTGAGDSFSAGLIFGWLSGLDLSASGTLASALGALATTVNGGGVDLPGTEELISFFLSDHSQISDPLFQSKLDQILQKLAFYRRKEGVS